jgi:hypothetical protein
MYNYVFSEKYYQKSWKQINVPEIKMVLGVEPHNYYNS